MTGIWRGDAGRAIILVDDDHDNALILEMLLTMETSFQILSYSNGMEVLKHIEDIKKSRPALFIIDRLMPQIDGLILCEHLRTLEEFQTTPFVLLTGLVDVTLFEEVKKKGILLAQKPYDMNWLLNLIHQATTPQVEAPMTTD